MLRGKMAARHPTDTTVLWILNSSAHKRLHYYNVSTYLQTNSLLRVYFPRLPLTWLSAQALAAVSVASTNASESYKIALKHFS